MTHLPDPHAGEAFLLAPGPLTTSYAVKQAMLRDHDSHGGDFRAMTARICAELVTMANGHDEYVCVPMPGDGALGVEAMLGTLVPRHGKVLVLANGALGRRAADMLGHLGRAHEVIDKGDYLPPRGDELRAALQADPAITHVLATHCDPSSGILNPLEEIAAVVADEDCRLLIDGTAAFGALPVDLKALRAEALVASPEACIEGVPGVCVVLARRRALEEGKGAAQSLSLDLHAQWTCLEKTGLWRFTPPTHVVAAFDTALRLHAAEGGVIARGRRYGANRDTLVEGMRALGFETLLPDRWLSPIIVTFFCPADPAFRFAAFHDGMAARGFRIRPGVLNTVDSFRIGCIGQIDTAILRRVVAAAKDTLSDMGIPSAEPPAAALAERSRLAG